MLWTTHILYYMTFTTQQCAQQFYVHLHIYSCLGMCLGDVFRIHESIFGPLDKFMNCIASNNELSLVAPLSWKQSVRIHVVRLVQGKCHYSDAVMIS